MEPVATFIYFHRLTRRYPPRIILPPLGLAPSTAPQSASPGHPPTGSATLPKARQPANRCKIQHKSRTCPFVRCCPVTSWRLVLLGYGPRGWGFESLRVHHSLLLWGRRVNYYAPQFKDKSFTCPICGVFAHQAWAQCGYYLHQVKHDPPLFISRCVHCSQVSYWFEGILIIPSTAAVELPSPDLPEECAADYNEARDIGPCQEVSVIVVLGSSLV